MLTYLKQIKNWFLQSYVSIMLTINIVANVFGIFYLLSNRNHGMWNIYGFILLVAFLGNIVLAFKEEKKWLGLLYLLFSTFGMLIIPIANTLVSIKPANYKSQSVVSFVVIDVLIISGAILSMLQKQQREIHISSIRKNESKGKNIVSNAFLILLSFGLLSGLFFVFTILRENREAFIEFFVSTYALFFAFTFLSIGVFIMKAKNKKSFVFRTVILTATTLIFMVCMLPFLSTPVFINNAEISYIHAFGDYKENAIYNQRSGFRQVRFSIPEYFYGIESGEYTVSENISYYKGTEGVDKDLELSFDVYIPKVGEGVMPGNHTVLIRIHGGGWKIGDKGAFNFPQMNKYFASKGYIVFDIQYGLYNEKKLIDFVPVDETRVGNFSVDDMVRHIGIFTTYLANHSEEYNANINSVFISGGSAGGHLTLAAGLGMASGKYEDLFDSRITVKGLIPFYPANGLSSYVGINGKNEFVDPIYLVDLNSPPCLIYQGSHDGLVDPSIAKRFRNGYINKGNSKCAIITPPFGGHASDIYFSGYYNQVFLYYMERFMYQYK